MDIRESYDSAAQVYAEHLAGELAYKPLDRHVLQRFAEEVRDKGRVADLGCGPGHVSQYLSEWGVRTVGVDISPAMIAWASDMYPSLEFDVGDMRDLDFPNATFAGVVSFYSIVHFNQAELTRVLREIRRVVFKGGLALFAFHIGDDVVHTEDLFGATVSLDFQFHRPETVIDALKVAGFELMERCEREPYEGVEYQSRRCYLLVRAV